MLSLMDLDIVLLEPKADAPEKNISSAFLAIFEKWDRKID